MSLSTPANWGVFRTFVLDLWGSFGGSDGKESTWNAGNLGLITGSGRSPGEANGNPLQHSCLKNSMDRGAWWTTVHGVAKSRIQLSNSACMHIIDLSWFKLLSVPHVSTTSSLLLKTYQTRKSMCSTWLLTFPYRPPGLLIVYYPYTDFHTAAQQGSFLSSSDAKSGQSRLKPRRHSV